MLGRRHLECRRYRLKWRQNPVVAFLETVFVFGLEVSLLRHPIGCWCSHQAAPAFEHRLLLSRPQRHIPRRFH